MIDKAMAPTTIPIPAIITGSMSDVRRLSECSMSLSKIDADRIRDVPKVPEDSPARRSGDMYVGIFFDLFSNNDPIGIPLWIFTISAVSNLCKGANETVPEVFEYDCAT